MSALILCKVSLLGGAVRQVETSERLKKVVELFGEMAVTLGQPSDSLSVQDLIRVGQ